LFSGEDFLLGDSKNRDHNPSKKFLAFAPMLLFL